MHTGIYVMGRKIKRGQPAPKTKAQFAKALGWQLYKALQERAIELRELDQKNIVDPSLTGPIQAFWNEILEVHDKTEKLGIYISTSLMNRVNRLQKISEDFDAYVDKNLDCARAEHLLLGMTLAELCEDVHHFTRQIVITHFSISIDDTNKNLPFRPTDWKKKDSFIQEIHHYQGQRGGKFPPHNILAKRMALKGYKLAERTYRDWKRQFLSGKFKDFVQDR
jgi:hypothetical protein